MPDTKTQSTSADTTPAPRFNPKRFCANLLLTLASILLVFVLSEAALRLVGAEPKTASALNSYFQFDPETGWRGRPNVAMQFATMAFSGFTSHGPDGFRVTPAPASAPTQSAWCLGDSGTWGWGVSDGQTYVDHLNQDPNLHTAFRNMGICGYSTVQQFLLLRDLLTKNPNQPPDLVLLLFCSNDLPENMDWKDQSPPRPYYAVDAGKVELRNYPAPPSSMSLRTWLKQNSLAYNHLNFYLTSAKRAMKNRMATGDPNQAPSIPEEHWLALRHGFRQIRDLCNQHNTRFLPVFLPPALLRHGHNLTPAAKQYDQNLQQRFLQVARDLSLHVIDISPQIAQYFDASNPNPPRLSFTGDPHFNAAGHALIAQAIATHLQSLPPTAHQADVP